MGELHQQAAQAAARRGYQHPFAGPYLSRFGRLHGGQTVVDEGRRVAQPQPEEPMTQQALGQRLGIDRTTIVTVVDGLDQKTSSNGAVIPQIGEATCSP